MRLSGSMARPWRMRALGERRSHRPAVHLDRAGCRVGAEDSAGDLGAAAADEPGEADDLAGADVERHVGERRREP